MKMIKAVIFDLNGVFIKSDLLSNRFQRDYGISSEEVIAALKDVMPKVRQPKAPPCYALWKPYLNKWNIKLDEKEFFQYWFSGEHLVPKMLEYAQELINQKIKVFLLSNNFKERTTYYREHFPELFRVVDKAYFSWETGFVKPDRKAYLSIGKENRLKLEECIYFDDSEQNATAARSSGMHAERWEGLARAKKTIDALLKEKMRF